MRVLFISPFLPYPVDNGSKMRAMNFLRSLRGHEVVLLAFMDEEEIVYKEELLQFCSELNIFQKPKISAFQVFVNHFSLGPLLSKRLYVKEANIKIKEVLKDKKIDLVIADTLLMAEYARKLKGLFKILNEHNLEFMRAVRRVYTYKSWIKKVYYYFIMKRLKRYELKAIRDFDGCFVCSETDKKTLSNSLAYHAIKVVPNSVDIDYFHPKQGTHDSKKIIFTGTMWYEPNVDAVKYFAKDIFPTLREDIPDLELIIVGDRPTEDVQNLSSDGNITVTGYVDDIRPYLYDASVFVAPIRMGSGTRLKILSAMSMSLPVVSTTVGCEGLEVCDGENICIADTPQQFSEMTLKLLKDIKFWNRIASGGRVLVEQKYSNKSIERELFNFWDLIERKLERNV